MEMKNYEVNKRAIQKAHDMAALAVEDFELMTLRELHVTFGRIAAQLTDLGDGLAATKEIQE